MLLNEYDIFMTAFRKVAADREQLKLINVYKGISVSYPATIAKLLEDTIVVKTNPHQLVCLERDEETYIRCSKIEEVLRARVIEISYAKSAAALTGFEPVGYDIGMRLQTRVQPDRFIEVIIQHIYNKGIILKGELCDLSQNGMAVYVSLDQVPPRVFVKATGVIIYLHMTDGENEEENDLVLNGAIENVRTQTYYGRARIGIRLLYEKGPPPILTKFIEKRRERLIDEIKEIAKNKQLSSTVGSDQF